MSLLYAKSRARIRRRAKALFHSGQVTVDTVAHLAETEAQYHRGLKANEISLLVSSIVQSVNRRFEDGLYKAKMLPGSQPAGTQDAQGYAVIRSMPQCRATVLDAVFISLRVQGLLPDDAVPPGS